MVTVPANEGELAANRQRTLSESVILRRNLNIVRGPLLVGCAWEATKLEVETEYIKLVIPVWA
jgi:hypothetical protein